MPTRSIPVQPPTLSPSLSLSLTLSLSLSLTLSLSLSLSLTLLPAPAHAGNNFTFLMGGRAAGMAGAYTAMAEEASTTWYNPAALGFNRRSSLEVTANAFFLQMLRVPEFIRTKLPSGEYTKNFDLSSFQVVGTSLSFVYHLGKDERAPVAAPGEASAAPPAKPRISNSIAFSVFVPQSVKYSKDVHLVSREPSWEFRERLRIQTEDITYYIGPSWGMRIGDDLSVGAGLYAVYTTGLFRGAFNMDLGSAGTHYFFQNAIELTLTEIGAAAVFGVQWRPIGGLRLGLTVRPPVLRFLQSPGGSSLFLSALPDDQLATATAFQDESVGEGKKGVAVAGPFSATLGVAWVQPGRFAVSVDADYTAPHSTDDGDFRGYANFRLGAEVNLTSRFALSFGAFTDFNPVRDVNGFAEASLDYYGGTLALTLFSPYRVVESDKTDLITFATTVGLKYAYGFGRVVGIHLDLEGQGDELASTRDFPATMHDISVVVGTSILF